MTRSKKAGFTLAEIMVVVMVMSIIFAMAVPNFAKARQNGRLQAIVENLKQIQTAKVRWAMEKQKSSSDVAGSTDLVPTYMPAWPVGPVGVATDYLPGAVSDNPTFMGVALDDFQAPDPTPAINTCAL
jgi:prepilin-type N-terminal cleavage/methylation domain-containing protein